MILVQRQSIHGLTTAAGIWTTAAIGMAIGAGMYVVGVVGSVLVLVGLELLKRMLRFAIPKIYQLSIETQSRESIETVIQELTNSNIEIRDYHVKAKEKNYEAAFKLQAVHALKRNELAALLHKVPDITGIRVY